MLLLLQRGVIATVREHSRAHVHLSKTLELLQNVETQHAVRVPCSDDGWSGLQ